VTIQIGTNGRSTVTAARVDLELERFAEAFKILGGPHSRGTSTALG
jgi:hypothetical protein